MNQMKNPPKTFNYKGKSLGILCFAAIQFFIGLIHVFFGVWLLAAESAMPFSDAVPNMIYDIYTIFFGLCVLVFTWLIWNNFGKLGWIGTVVVSIFVVVADSLTLLNLPSIPGIPKVAGATEIIYSTLVIGYLSHGKVGRKFFAAN
jgi:hypothetical protein